MTPRNGTHDRQSDRALTATDVMTAHEVATLLHAPVSTVEDWARRDILPSVKIGRRRLYVRQSIEAMLTDGTQRHRQPPLGGDQA
jgi:excisionase family DNA binding protein